MRFDTFLSTKLVPCRPPIMHGPSMAPSPPESVRLARRRRQMGACRRVVGGNRLRIPILSRRSPSQTREDSVGVAGQVRLPYEFLIYTKPKKQGPRSSWLKLDVTTVRRTWRDVTTTEIYDRPRFPKITKRRIPSASAYELTTVPNILQRKLLATS